jgi:hypothetical protein
VSRVSDIRSKRLAQVIEKFSEMKIPFDVFTKRLEDAANTKDSKEWDQKLMEFLNENEPTNTPSAQTTSTSPALK